jgi:hypothetical protein
MNLTIHKRKPTKIAAVALLMFFFVLFAAPQEASAERRIALVIGNGAYGADPLSDPPNDAQLVADTLRNLGFEVTRRIDVNQRTMEILIRDFGKRLKDQKDSVGLFYYSGHGMQVAGENYMIPVGVTIEDESDVEISGIDVNQVLTRMRYAGNRMNFLVLDACRDNPFEKSFKSAAKGLGRMDAPKGTLIAYAAEPHKVAKQGRGNYSYFTEALAREIVKPGISARDMLLNVRKAVHTMTDGKQLPVVEDKLLDKFYFKPAAYVTREPEDSPPVRETKQIIDRDGMFIAYNNGVVRDPKTGLEWVAGPDRDMSWDEAKSWVQGLNIDGGGWRMPTLEELETLYTSGAGTRNMTRLLKTTGWKVYSGKTRDSSSAWHFYFWDGRKYWGSRYDPGAGPRAFAVRSRSGG